VGGKGRGGIEGRVRSGILEGAVEGAERVCNCSVRRYSLVMVKMDIGSGKNNDDVGKGGSSCRWNK